jgi:hypothetical protein
VASQVQCRMLQESQALDSQALNAERQLWEYPWRDFDVNYNRMELLPWKFVLYRQNILLKTVYT